MPRQRNITLQRSLSRCARFGVLLTLLAGAAPAGAAEVLRVLVARTANDSGLVTRLAEAYRSRHPEVRVQIIPGGSMDLLERSRQGAADAVLGHNPEGEQLLVADGYALSRTLVMYNQFAIFGPPDDPLGLRRQPDLLEALQTIARAEPPFLVQGLRSGTRYRLQQLWTAANIQPDWIGYEDSHASSPTTLTTAAEFGAYCFADMASYLALPQVRRTQLVPLVRDHRALRNDYHYLVMNPAKVPGANPSLANDFLAFLISDDGQRLIGQFDTANSPIPPYTPAAHLDRGLQVRRAHSALEDQRHQLYMLGGGLSLALALAMFAWFVYRRARELTDSAVAHGEVLEHGLAAADAGVFDWNMVTDRLYITPPALQLLGLAEVEAHNLHALMRQALDNDQAGRVGAALQDYLNTLDDEPLVIVFDKDGKRLELRGRVTRDGAGTPRRLTGTLRLSAKQTTRPLQAEARLHDPLTGLPARQLLGDRLQHALRQAARDQAICAVLVIGLNAMRSATALSESAPDDALIKVVAERLRNLLRASDTLARLGDNSFAVVLNAVDNHHAELAREKLLAGLQRPFHVNHQTLHLDSAVGYANYPEHGQQPQSLLQRAQLAMLQATRDGRPLASYQAPSSTDRAAGKN